ncbi:hypothetical protein [Azospirillum sp. ST 5-10]|uniref:hypothetical protein n=1 Tax=unclassified Azospirillum TaxID=2630922 RepID=UPI003F4A45CC
MVTPTPPARGRPAAVANDGDGRRDRQAPHPWLLDEPLGHTLASERAWLDWRWLTTVDTKVRYYGGESYFRESLADAGLVLGDGAVRLLQELTVLVFKPDAVVGRRIPVALEFLHRRGFTPLFARPFAYGRLHLREDWRFQLNQLTLDRMRLNTLLAGMSPSLMVVLRDETPPEHRRVPASVRLQMLKGPSHPERQTAEHLRFALRSWSRLLKFVHAPDEPADLVREIGILFDGDDRRALYAAMAAARRADTPAGPDAAIADLHARHPAHDLDHGHAVARLAADLRDRAARDPALDGLHRRFESALAACAAGRTLAWMPFERDLAAAGVPLTWDHLVLAAATIQHSFDGEAPFVPSDGTAGWLAGRGRLA